MAEENINREFRLKDINETRNHLIEGINGNELMGKKHKKYLYNSKLYKKNFLILGSTITGCISISSFASLVGIPIGV